MKIVGIQQPDRGVSGGSTVRGRLPRECRVHSRRVLVGSRRQARDDSDRATPAGSRHRVRSTGPAGREDGLHRTELSCPRRRGGATAQILYPPIRLCSPGGPTPSLSATPMSPFQPTSRVSTGKERWSPGLGKKLADATPDQALAAVVGYSTFNDLTCRRAQKLTSQWILGKNGDRSGPLGPMVPASEVGDLRDGLRIQTRVNGEIVQDARTDEMVLYSRRHPLSHLSDLHTAPRRSPRYGHTVGSRLRTLTPMATTTRRSGRGRSRKAWYSSKYIGIQEYSIRRLSKNEAPCHESHQSEMGDPPDRPRQTPECQLSPTSRVTVNTFLIAFGEDNFRSRCSARCRSSDTSSVVRASDVAVAFVSSPTISRNTKTSRSTTGSVVGGGSDPPLNPSDAAPSNCDACTRVQHA